ncbi:MAG TPA: hypothetical protein PKH77_17470 [Anaerolineae bacterium]|nr:hypothetical protein [Anaerolineae bacterium]
MEKGQVTGNQLVGTVLLAPALHPADILGGINWTRKEVPQGSSSVNICAQGDFHCPLEVRNVTENINPPRSAGHGPHGNYAAQVYAALDIVGDHQARQWRYSPIPAIEQQFAYRRW